MLQNVDPLGLAGHAKAKDLKQIFNGVIKKARGLGVPTEVLEAAQGKTGLAMWKGFRV